MKITYILALLAIVANVVLGVMNRNKFIATRKQKDENTRAVYQNFKKVDDENKTSNGHIDNWNLEDQRYNRDNTARQNEDGAKKSAEGKIADAVKATNEAQMAIDAINKEIQTTLAGFGGTPEELQARRDTLKAETEEMAKKIEVLSKEIDVTNGIIGEHEKVISRFNQQQTDRSKAIQLGSREGTINAVNPDWAFVIVNMGKDQGVNNDSKLLVKRGTQLLGKLKITQIEKNLTVADIDPKSLTGGEQIVPGDQVIFDTAN